MDLKNKYLLSKNLEKLTALWFEKRKRKHTNRKGRQQIKSGGLYKDAICLNKKYVIEKVNKRN